MITETIKIEGMTCAGACVRNVRQALSTLEGLKVDEVGLGYAKIAFDPDSNLLERSRQAIEEAGFKAMN